ncbi:hypothetical protein FACS1894122_12550 [Alphaproteobacteria bacterium]|nr:hypothetical protein FACS1894122_12550 [Alphaproteobacteria bacterium]
MKAQGIRRRSVLQAQGGTFDSVIEGRGGDLRGFPQAFASAAGRLSVCVAEDDPAPVEILIAQAFSAQ